MTFKVCNLGSKQPYFYSSYEVRVPIFPFRTVSPFISSVLCNLFYFSRQKSAIFHFPFTNFYIDSENCALLLPFLKDQIAFIVPRMAFKCPYGI